MPLNFTRQNSFTKIYRTKPYEFIDPTQPKLSAAGKTVLITAGHTGIGYSIAQSFGLAGASHVILLGRRVAVLETAVKQLSTEHPNTKYHSVTASIADNSQIKEVFTHIHSNISPVADILVTCAVHVNPSMPTLALPESGFVESITTNVLGNVYLVREFLGDPATLSASKEKAIIDVSSLCAHTIMNQVGSSYGVSKLAFSQWLAHLSDEVKDQGVSIYSIHPGAILTEAVRSMGMDEKSFNWDDARLPGHFVVWLASKEAEFLRGRFVWANWDVEEMVERKEEFESEPDLLKIGLMH